MHIIYCLINRRKEKVNEYPCYYIGSKTNFVSGKYWGSSHHPVLKEELSKSKEDFEMKILIEVTDPARLTLIEREVQIAFNVINDRKYYNLHLANEKFSAIGRKWFHDPVTLAVGLFSDCKVPPGWHPGHKKASDRTPGSIKAAIWKANPTGLRKDDPLLHQKISDSIAKFEWIIRDPSGKLHTVTKLHQFCRDHKLSTRLRYAENFNVPIRRGSSKGWCVVSKLIIGAKPLL